MTNGPAGGFARWSQRKHAAREAARRDTAPTPLKDAEESVRLDADVAPTPQEHAGLPADAPIETRERAPERTSNDARPPLPPIEELTADSDYTQFLADGVPEALKRAALRKLWTSDPVLACLDGLNDYDEDFNVIDEVITAAQTDYKVGRGFLDDADQSESAVAPDPATQSAPETAHAEEPTGSLDQTERDSEARSADAAANDGHPLDSAAEDGPRQVAAEQEHGSGSRLPPDSAPESKG